jgi:hypothetical protein
MPDEAHHQRLFHREHGIRVEVRIAVVEDVRRHRLEAVRGDDEMHMRGAPRVPVRRAQQPANRTVIGDRVVHGTDRSHEIAAVAVSVKHAAEMQLVAVDMLGVVQTGRIRLPDIQRGARNGMGVQIEHASADHRRHAAAVARRDVGPGRQVRRPLTMEWSEDRRFGGAIVFPVVDQIHHHRDAEGVRQENEFLAAVIAHPAGFGEESDRVEPFSLGQIHLFDETMEVTNERAHDLPQSLVWRVLDPPQDLGGDVVLGRAPTSDRAVHLRFASRLCRSLYVRREQTDPAV